MGSGNQLVKERVEEVLHVRATQGEEAADKLKKEHRKEDLDALKMAGSVMVGLATGGDVGGGVALVKEIVKKIVPKLNS